MKEHKLERFVLKEVPAARYNFTRIYYKCTDCGMIAYQDRQHGEEYIISTYNRLDFKSPKAESISCDDFVIKSII